MDRSELMYPEKRLPAISLNAVPSGEHQPLRPPGRRASVVALAHGAECEACLAYLGLLAGRAAEIEEWNGRLIAVTEQPWEEARALPAPLGEHVLLLSDPYRQVARACGVSVPALLVADRWGALYLAHPAGAEHRWPPPEEVLSALKYLAIQCPECEGEAY
jgi:peroxiredoxin